MCCCIEQQSLFCPFLLSFSLSFQKCSPLTLQVFKLSTHFLFSFFFSITSKMHPNVMSYFTETLRSAFSCVVNGLNNQHKLSSTSKLFAPDLTYYFPDLLKMLPKWSFICINLILSFKHTSWSFQHWSFPNHFSLLYTYIYDPTN